MPTLIVLSGFVDSDIRIATPNGKKVAEFRVNTGDGWSSVVAWEELADKVPPRGSHLVVHGRLRTRSYDKNGVKVYVTEVIASVIEQVGVSSPETRAPAPTGAATFDD